MGSSKKQTNKMKRFAILAVAISAEKIEFCSDEIGAEEPYCKEQTDRSFANSRSIIETIICPDGENSANVNCAGYTLNNGNTQTFRQALNSALNNYGCNCFSPNHRIPNVNGGSGFHLMPGNNGEPIDDFDAACKILARRHKCLNFDYGLNSGLEFHHPNPERAVCDYVTGYRYEYDSTTGEITCGPANNPGYANNGPWYQLPENIKRYNSNQCRRAVCEMDLEFARYVAPLLNDPRGFRLANRNNKNISNTAACVAPGTQGSIDTCCGPMEQRNPFNSGSKRCCQDIIVDIGSSDESSLC